jgi:hypothetical protein
MPITYRCSGFAPIKRGAELDVHEGIKLPVDTVADAARAFASRYARRKFGRRGFCHHVRQDSYRQDGTAFDYEAFVCDTVGPHRMQRPQHMALHLCGGPRR